MVMKFKDYSIMMLNLDPDSCLMSIVRIRKEKDIDKISKFSDDERRIWAEWNNKSEHKKANHKTIENRKKELDEMFRAAL